MGAERGSLMLSVCKCYLPFGVASASSKRFIEIGTRICEMALTAGERAIYMQISALCHCHCRASAKSSVALSLRKAKKEWGRWYGEGDFSSADALRQQIVCTEVKFRNGWEDATAAG